MNEDELAASLAEALAPADEQELPDDLDPETAGTDDAPWRIDGERTASWALRKMAEAQRVVDEHERKVEAFYAAELEKLNAWRATAMNEVRREARTVEFMDAHLRVYLRRLRADDAAAGLIPRTVVNVPGGRLSCFRSQSLTVLDPNALMVWAAENGYSEMLKPVEPSVKGIKGLLLKDDEGLLHAQVVDEDTGEVFDVPGVKVEVHDNYSIKPA